MTIHRDLHNMYQAGFATYVTAAGQSISCTKWGEVFEVTTGSTSTLTLLRPTKPGIICAVVFSVKVGTFTLTVTGGYNLDGDTAIAFTAAGDRVVLQSVQTGSTFQWSILAQEGTDAAVEEGTFDTATITALSHSSTDLAEYGAGATGTGVDPSTTRYTRDGVIITDIKVDITGLGCKGDAQGDAIGLVAGGDAYIGRNVLTLNGIIYRIEMICLETPAGSATSTLDIDLMAEDDSDVAYDGPVDDTVIARAGSWAAGQVAITNVPALTSFDYFYLGEGDTAATTGVYTAGMFLIRLYGHPVLS